MTFVVLDTASVPASWRPRLAELTVEGYWAMSRWLHQDGSCWVAVAFAGTDVTPTQIVGWACLTCEDGEWPVVGVYVARPCRGQGYATLCVSLLLAAKRQEIEERGSVVCAVGSRWSRYPRVIRDSGFEHREWE